MRPQSMQTVAGYQGVLESPLPGQYLKDSYEISGWLRCGAPGQHTILVFVDGQPVQVPVTQLSRPDIAAQATAFEAMRPVAGFHVIVSCKDMPPGGHVVAVVVQRDGKAVAQAQAPVVYDERKRFVSAWEGPLGDLRINGFLQVDGFVVHEAPARIRLYIDGQPADAEFQWRPHSDLASRLPPGVLSDPNAGFTASVFTSGWDPGPHTVALVAETATEALVLESRPLIWEEQLPLHRYLHLTPSAAYRRAKLERTLGVLACPGCGGSVAQASGDQLRCVACESLFPLVDLAPVMVVGTPQHPVIASELNSPASNHPYSATWFRMLHEVCATGGLALDIGSGRRSFGSDCLIQLEICNYPFTDVVSQGAILPFQDESFDLILSGAVTEHVRQPWVLAAEIQRVAKPGALICVDSAFLQPLHGYPDHFFNMTAQGLASLFPNVEVQSLQAEPHQHPFFPLYLLLKTLHDRIPPDKAERLRQMTAGELMVHLGYYLSAAPNLFADIEIPRGYLDAFAAGYTLVGRRLAGKSPQPPQ